MREQIANWFLRHGRLLEPEALDTLMSAPAPMDRAEEVLRSLSDDELFITNELVRRAIKDIGKEADPSKVASTAPPAIEEKEVEPDLPVVVTGKQRIPAKDLDFSISSYKDISKVKGCTGEINDFVGYFRDRYNRLRGLLRLRHELKGAMPINKVKKGTEAVVIGMISETTTSKAGHKIADIEDDTGSMRILYTKLDVHLISDEVVGIVGKVLPDKKGFENAAPMLAANQIIRPQVQRRTMTRSKEDVEMAVISDTHMGSKTFLKDEWNAFIDFLNGRGPYGDHSGKVKYLVIAGDVADGIGIYPGHKEDLEVVDLYEQYEFVGQCLEDIPEHIKVIILPGNHDAVRGTEPQPMFEERIQDLIGRQHMFVGNPSGLDIHGVKVLAYHGRSIDDFVSMVPGVTYDEPLKAMEMMLDIRHLAPIYGNKTPLAPGSADHMVIDTVPDIFITGHVHYWDMRTHNSVLMISGSTWQAQTDYQRMMNFNPIPARVSIVNLYHGKARALSFMGMS